MTGKIQDRRNSTIIGDPTRPGQFSHYFPGRTFQMEFEFIRGAWRGCNVERCIHICVNYPAALRALKPLAYAPPKAPTPAAPFRGVGRIHVQDWYTTVKRTLLHEVQQRNKRSVLK